MKILFFLTLCTINLLPLPATETPSPTYAANPTYLKVLDAIEHSAMIPGLSSDTLSTLRHEMKETWNSLNIDHRVQITGTDQDIRPLFVGLQGIIEQVLANSLGKDLHLLKGAIHTPMPPTPLCTEGSLSPQLVDPSIEKDPTRLFTVQARTIILRDFLAKGGTLYSVYPKNGLNKRTEQQRAVYQKELLNYPDHLIDAPLLCEEFPQSLIGATYVFEDDNKELWIFSINMTQAKDPQALGSFGLWFGPITHPVIEERLNALNSYCVQHGFLLMHKLTSN